MAKVKYYQKEMLDDYALGSVCLVVFQDCSAEVGYLMETANLSPKDRIGVHRSSKYCILPLNPKKGKMFFNLKHIKEIVYYNNRFILPHTKAEDKRVWKEINVDLLGRVINHTMPFENFKMLVEEAYKE